MPFKKGMKIVITNESDRPLPLLYYDVDYTVGDPHGEDELYFHAHYRRENRTSPGKDYPVARPGCVIFGRGGRRSYGRCGRAR